MDLVRPPRLGSVVALQEQLQLVQPAVDLVLVRLQPVAGRRGEGPMGEMVQVVVLVLGVLEQHHQLWLG